MNRRAWSLKDLTRVIKCVFSSVVEHCIHPIRYFGRLAQLVRALHSHCRGQRFKSSIVHQKSKNLRGQACKGSEVCPVALHPGGDGIGIQSLQDALVVDLQNITQGSSIKSMKKSILLAVLLLSFLSFSVSAEARTTRVKGYYKPSTGRYVAPHYKTTPNRTKIDNYSTKGNYNPYTGKKGTVNLYRW